MFWAVAVPFTVFVLLVCPCITQYKFKFKFKLKLRRRFWTILFWPLAYFQRSRDGMSHMPQRYSDA